MMFTHLALWTLLAVICMGRAHQSMEHAQQASPTADGSDKISLVESANEQFAFILYSHLLYHTGSEGKNIFFSPVSVSAALAALSVGARGETHQQLFSGLGFNSFELEQTDVNHAFHALIGTMASHELSQGTAVFVDNLFKPNPDFLHVLKQCYFTDSFSVDFTKPKETANTINQYVSGRTNGKINKLVDGLDPSTVLYLLSHIYFKGTWETPFDPKLTKPDVFRVDEDTEVLVQMMRMEDVFDTYYDQVLNASVLRLPFNNSFFMLLVLPENMRVLEENLSPAHINWWLQGLKPRKYKIFVPKFSIKTSYTLNDVLTGMGMVDMFGDRADLSGIAEGQKLVVSEVVHEATLDVDEAGATAAAATGIGIVPFSAAIAPALKFNHPFGVIITDGSSRNMLFMGKIVNPTI